MQIYKVVNSTLTTATRAGVLALNCRLISAAVKIVPLAATSRARPNWRRPPLIRALNDRVSISIRQGTTEKPSKAVAAPACKASRNSSTR